MYETRAAIAVFTVRVHGQRPVHQVEIQVCEPELLETGVDGLLDAGVEGAPQLGGDEEVLALDDAGINALLDSLADLVLVAVALRRVDVAVADLDGVGDGLSDLARGGLPGAQTEGRDLSASVELEAGVCSHCVEYRMGWDSEGRKKAGVETQM